MTWLADRLPYPPRFALEGSCSIVIRGLGTPLAQNLRPVCWRSRKYACRACSWPGLQSLSVDKEVFGARRSMTTLPGQTPAPKDRLSGRWRKHQGSLEPHQGSE